MCLSRAGLLFAAATAFLLDPAACATDSSPDYQYGAAEMRAAVEGSWIVTTTASGASASFTIHLEQATGPAMTRARSLVRPAMACGTRTLIKGAAACVDVSEMPLTGQVTDGDEATRAMKVDGELRVSGLTFTAGDVTIRIGSRSLHGQLSKDGVVSQVYGDLPTGGSVTIVRGP